LKLCKGDPSGTNVSCSNLDFDKLNSSNLFD